MGVTVALNPAPPTVPSVLSSTVSTFEELSYGTREISFGSLLRVANRDSAPQTRPLQSSTVSYEASVEKFVKESLM